MPETFFLRLISHRLSIQLAYAGPELIPEILREERPRQKCVGDELILMRREQKILVSSKPSPFCKPLRSPGIDSQPGGLVRQPSLSDRLAKLHRLAESIPGLHQRLQIRTLFPTRIWRYCRRKLYNGYCMYMYST
jgi:hypothetical protein